MLENLLAVIQEEHLSEQLYHSLIGIALSEQRVDENGQLSLLPQPAPWRDQPRNIYLRPGEMTSQIRVLTEPNPNIGGTLDRLDTLQTVVYRSLEGSDRIWPLSVPPVVDTARLASLGPDKQIDWLTGIKLGYSLPDPVIHRLYSHYTNDFDSVVAFKNFLYFRVAQNFVRYQWLLTYLFGASPLAERGLFETLPTPLATPVRSLRYCGALPATAPVTYTSLGAHLGALQRLSAMGAPLTAEPVVLKGQAAPQDFLTGGIGYLELHGFDNTPFTANGVSRHALYFFKMFMIYLLTTPVPTTNLATELATAHAKNKTVAMEEPGAPTQFLAQGEAIFEQMRIMAAKLYAHTEQWGAIDDLEEVLEHPELTPAAKLLTHVHQGSLMTYGMEVANNWSRQRLEASDILPVYKALSPHCQRFIFTAMQAGVQFYQVKDEFGADLLLFTHDGITQVLQERDTRTQYPLYHLHQLFPELKK